ncbi:MAG: sigma-70 family RNA polymerase sigma factor [Planctomycetota bacterium]|jgi:RNA polymerase sigma-70 factor (ECF subfamily)|nr:sigma-70 family RNA polymerase sigma factor [Planctomycetota bacterium]
MANAGAFALSLPVAGSSVNPVETPAKTEPVSPVEAGLLARYAEGDDSAMDELILQYQQPAFWIARHVVNSDDMALDIVQDAFVRLLRNHQRYDPTRSSFKAWFFQIVRNMAIDHLRKARVRVSSELVETADATPRHDKVEQAELGERIRSVIDSLAEPYRELLIMRDVEGMSPQDIAAITEADYGTTRWRIHNARKLFRQEWQARFGAEVA